MGGGRGSLALVKAEGPCSPRRPGCWGGGKTADGPRCPPLQTVVHSPGQSLERKFSLLKEPKPLLRCALVFPLDSPPALLPTSMLQTKENEHPQWPSRPGTP